MIGIQLTVVRQEMTADPEDTLAKLAAIGYRVVNPVGFNGLTPKAYRAMLDRHSLSAPQIDLGFSIGPDMKTDLDACRILGAKFAEPAVAAGGRGSISQPTAANGRGGTAVRGGRGVPQIPQTPEMGRRAAADYNAYGKAAAEFGIKAVFHNHAEHLRQRPEKVRCILMLSSPRAIRQQWSSSLISGTLVSQQRAYLAQSGILIAGPGVRIRLVTSAILPPKY